MRDSAVFYRSFYEAVKELPAEQFKACVSAIMEYALDGKEPESSGIEKTVYLMAKPQIDANNKRYLNGTKGGRPKTECKPSFNQTLTNPEASRNQFKTKPEQNTGECEPNENDNVNENDIKEKSSYEDKKKELTESMSADAAPLSRFEDFWNTYPATDPLPVTAKRRTETAYAVASAEGFSESDLIATAENYAEVVRIEAREARYIKRPERFLADGTYKGYLPDVYVKPEAIRKKPTAADRYNAGIMSRDVDLDALERELLGKDR